jgi:hypothetical protein
VSEGTGENTTAFIQAGAVPILTHLLVLEDRLTSEYVISVLILFLLFDGKSPFFPFRVETLSFFFFSLIPNNTTTSPLPPHTSSFQPPFLFQKP